MTSKLGLYMLNELDKRGGEMSSLTFKRITKVIAKDLEVLEILKKKEVAIDELKNCIKNNSEDRPSLEEYNAFAGDENSLTKEEFNKIKEWLENDK